jgi:putative glutamine amidotransferase
MEFTLCRLAHQMHLPTLGICRGLQVMNCALGGTLHQHVNGADLHQRTDRPREGVHSVSVEKNTLLHRILKQDKIMVNSRHHQAVKQPGKGLLAAAHAEDGLAEAAEDPSRRFFLGVQWHPESMYETDENAQNIFAGFAAAVKEHT